MWFLMFNKYDFQSQKKFPTTFSMAQQVRFLFHFTYMFVVVKRNTVLDFLKNHTLCSTSQGGIIF